MQEPLVLLLLFVGVTACAWVVTSLIFRVGSWVTQEATLADNSPYAPIRHFTTPEKLARQSWMAAMVLPCLVVAVLVVAGLYAVYILLPAALLAGLVGYVAPRLILKQRIKRRMDQFQRRLLDLTVGMSNGMRAGTSLPQALSLVARDLGGPIGEEINLLLQEHRLGVELSECFDRLSLRMPGEDLKLLATAVRLTIRTGGSLSDVLEKITDTIRQRTEFKERLRTMTTQGRFEALAMALAPLAAFLMFMAIDRELMKPMLQTPLGWGAIGLVLTMEVVGFFCINKIVTVEA